MKVAVLGIGSPHGDDRIGWVLVDELQKLTPHSDIYWEKVSAPVTSLVNQLSAYDYILALDAAELARTPGESVFIQNAAGALEQQESLVSSHSMGLLESWQLARALDMKLPAISLFLVQMEQTEPMQPISVSLEKKIPDMLEELANVLAEQLSENVSV